MKNLSFWQVDAFTAEKFKGNPAAVFILYEELDNDLMQNIAAETNLPETAFVLIRKEQNPILRWFTPTNEIDLCGHATLASAHVLFDNFYPTQNIVTFATKFVGELKVWRSNFGLTMDFPVRSGEELSLKQIPSFVLNSLTTAAKPICAYQARDLMLVYKDEKIIREMTPNFNSLVNYPSFVIVTAASENPKYDFISRFFSPQDGVLEDPVTGSAHCTLAPYWGNRLKKPKLIAYQASKRGGELLLEIKGDRVLITGQAVTVLKGELFPTLS